MSLFKFCIPFLLWGISAARGTRSGPMEQLFKSSCVRQVSTMAEDDLKTLDRLLPPTSFLENLNMHVKKHMKRTVLLLEVDRGSHRLALNHIECLKLSNASVTPFVVAYEDGVCEMMHLNGTGGCFYDKGWGDAIVSFYHTTADPRSHAVPIYRAMLGRMMTTVVTLCAGYNVFLSDADVVYYRDPVDYAFRDADIMITSTFIEDNIYHKNYGGYFYATRPTEYSTMNNGVVLFKSTNAVRNLHITMATESLKTLWMVGDHSNGFLQVDFNKYMIKHHLSVRPCSEVSDPVTKKLDAVHPLFGGNKARECFDCYYGNITWTSDVIKTNNSNTGMPLQIGVFPMERFVSHCAIRDVEELTFVTATAAAALKANDPTHWGWGEDIRPDSSAQGSQAYLIRAKTRPVSAHVNCSPMEIRFSGKETILRLLNSWYVES